LFEVSTAWAVVGEPTKLSASLSTDPDGDTMLFSWKCDDGGGAAPVAQAPHTHGNGVTTLKPVFGSVLAAVTNRTLPPADFTYQGDFCNQLGKGTPFSPAQTIEGTFGHPCKCTMTLVAT